MALLAPSTPPMSPSFSRKRKSWARRCERLCCSVVSYFPLVIVYGLTTWAVWVQADIGFTTNKDTWTGRDICYLSLNTQSNASLHRPAYRPSRPYSLPSPELVVHYSGMGESGIPTGGPGSVLVAPICRSSRQYLDHGQVHRRLALL